MKKEMLINVLQPEECRIAILENGVLEELYVERTSHESYVGNIYKGRIVNIEPSIQAAFVDFGVGRNGFLHVSDVEPAYYRHLEQQGSPRGRDNGRGRDDRGGRGGRDDRGGRGGRNDRGGRGGDRGRKPRPGDRPSQQKARSRELEMLDEDERELAMLSQDEQALQNQDDRTGEPSPSSERPPEEPPEALTDTALEPEPEPEARPFGEGLEIEESEPSPEPPAPTGRGRKEAEPGKERRGRGRGGSRRKSADKAAEPTSEPTPPEPEARDDDDPPRPRLMDSAERRTEDDDDVRSAPLTDDDLLFFPRSESEPVTPEIEPGPDDDPVTEQDDIPIDEPEDEELSFAPADDDVMDDGPPPVMEPPARREEFFQEDPGHEDDDPRLGDEFGDEFGEGPPQRRGRGPGDRGDRGGDRRGGPRRRLGGRPGMGRPKPLIQDIFKRGQEVLVQVIKEGLGTKGPTLSTYISIAGRYLVLMPGLNRVGVSRKIMDEDERRRLRGVMDELQPPKGLGFVIRTSAQERTKKELYRDLAYLTRLWQVVVRRIRKMKSPAEIFQESDMITRTIRDIFTSEIENIWVDESAAFEHAQEFLQVVMPRFASRIKHYQDTEPIFHKHGIEEEIARIQQKKVPLTAGGSIVIEQTEALVAIDVNSGNFRADNNAEETAYQMNLQAAKEIARQLRLRDLGGVIVNDFIDMRDEKHRRGVERAIRDAVKRDRARTKILRMSQFGIIEMTRQRIRPSLKRSVYSECSHCHGTGSVKTTESMSLEVMRLLQLAAHREHVQRIEIKVTEEVASYLLNRKRKEVSKLEESGEIAVQVTGVPGGAPELVDFLCFDNNNNEIKFSPYEDERPRPQPRRR